MKLIFFIFIICLECFVFSKVGDFIDVDQKSSEAKEIITFMLKKFNEKNIVFNSYKIMELKKQVVNGIKWKIKVDIKKNLVTSSYDIYILEHLKSYYGDNLSKKLQLLLFKKIK